MKTPKACGARIEHAKSGVLHAAQQTPVHRAHGLGGDHGAAVGIGQQIGCFLIMPARTHSGIGGKVVE